MWTNMLLKGYNWGTWYFLIPKQITEEGWKKINTGQFKPCYFLQDKKRRPCACVIFTSNASSLERSHIPDALNKIVIWSENAFPQGIKHVMFEWLSLPLFKSMCLIPLFKVNRQLGNCPCYVLERNYFLYLPFSLCHVNIIPEISVLTTVLWGRWHYYFRFVVDETEY